MSSLIKFIVFLFSGWHLFKFRRPVQDKNIYLIRNELNNTCIKAEFKNIQHNYWIKHFNSSLMYILVNNNDYWSYKEPNKMIKKYISKADY